MKKNKFKFAWSIAEKVICYVALSIVVITQIISLIFPDFSGLENEVTFGIFGAALILIFQNVNETKQQIAKKSNALFSQNFNEGLVSIWNKKQKIDTLDILCQTSNTYYHSIANQNITIDTLRILINKPKSNNTKHYPAQEVLAHFDVIRDQTIEMWKALQKRGKIRNLEIRYYEFDPTIHFAIINKKFVHYGLYKPEYDFPGYSLYPLYTLDAQESAFNQSQLEDLQDLFEHIRTNWSYIDEDLDPEATA